MANGKEGAGYWLPPDFLMDSENFGNSHNYELEPHFCFPYQFPFDFQTPCPKYDAVEDLIYLASGEVAKLRLNHDRVMINLPQFHKDTKISNPHVYPHIQFGSRSVRGMGHVAWDPYQNHSHGRAAPDGGGAAARKACAGTGVFLPRRYDTNSHSSYPRSRTSPGCSASPFQGRSSAQIHPKPLMYRFLESQPQHKLSRAFVPDHNSILARRRSFSTPMVEGRDHPRLPQEWSY